MRGFREEKAKLQCSQDNCNNEFEESDVHEITLDLGQGVMVHTIFPVLLSDGNILSTCQEHTQETLQEFINSLNDTQRQFMIDQSKKKATRTSIISLMKEI